MGIKKEDGDAAEKIDSFSGSYRFLSNFYPARVIYGGEEYRTSEHAYQAAKCINAEDRRKIRDAKTPGDAKRLGRRVKMIEAMHHDSTRVEVMRQIVLDKFKRNKDLAEKLVATGDTELVEGNTWGDEFWGKVGNSGHNWLGRVLMDVRKELLKGY